MVLPRVLTAIGAVHLAQGNFSEAETLLRESSRLAEDRWPDGAYHFHVMSLLGTTLVGQKKFSEAEPLLRKGYEGLFQRQDRLSPYLNAPRRIRESLERLAQLYDSWGKPAQAAEWKTKLAEFQQAAERRKKLTPAAR